MDAMTAKPKRALSARDRIDWLRLQRTPRVGPVTFHQLIRRFGDASSALDALPALARRGGGSLKPASRQAAEAELSALDRFGGRLLCWGEPGYPDLLAALEDAPPSIAVLGHAHLLERPCLAMVGARNASLNGRRLAGAWAKEIGAQGWVVVSGLARGIDAAAHEGALASGTIAAVAGGLDIVFPKEHTSLFERIAAEGLVVAESPLGTHPTARHFPRRNRIIAGLARGTLVVEAARRSGSLITARLANDYGREVLAVPGSPLDPRAQGANALIKQGAALVQGPSEILDILANLPAEDLAMPMSPDYAAPPPEISEDALDAARATLLDCLSPTPTPVDELIRESQLSAPLVQMVLVELELAGRVERLPGSQVALLAPP
jgi:DNA processing protein